MLAPMPTRASKNVISLRRISRLPYFSRLRSLTWLRLHSQLTAFAQDRLRLRGETLDERARGLDRIDESGILTHEQGATLGVACRPRGLQRLPDLVQVPPKLAFAPDPFLDERVAQNA